MTYTVVLRAESEEGFTVLVPALPGCVSFGATEAEALAMVRDAILCHVEGMESTGQMAPVEGSDTVLSIPVEELTGPLTIHRVSVHPEVVAVA